MQECVVFFATGIGPVKTELHGFTHFTLAYTARGSRITFHGINQMGIADTISMCYGNEAVKMVRDCMSQQVPVQPFTVQVPFYGIGHRRRAWRYKGRSQPL
jgi:hypothetical protein